MAIPGWRSSFYLVLAVPAMLLAGCANMIDATEEEKTASLALAPKELRFRGEPPLKFVQERSGTIVAGKTMRSVMVTKEGSVRVTFTDPKEEGKRKSKVVSGMAAALTRDGYYLTAAHVVDGKPPFWVFPAGLGTFNELPFNELRVVWIADGLDFAIVKADARLKKTYEPARGRPAIGDPIFVTGFGGKTSYGKVRHVLPISRSKVADVIRHNAPVRRGDSGGAVVDQEGRIVALTSAGMRTWNDAVAPDWDRTWQIIEEDRRTRR